jgi:hypothetical protein
VALFAKGNALFPQSIGIVPYLLAARGDVVTQMEGVRVTLGVSSFQSVGVSFIFWGLAVFRGVLGGVRGNSRLVCFLARFCHLRV